MKYIVDKEQRAYFNREGFIEFEGLVGIEKFNSLKNGINQALASRLSKDSYDILLQPSEELFCAGRDLWRDNNDVKRVVLNRGFAAVISDLFNEKELRIGIDQLIPKMNRSIPSKKIKDYINNEDWRETSSIQGVVAGLIIFLGDRAGGGVYVRPGQPLEPLLQQESCLFITYSKPGAVYSQNPADPVKNSLNKLGLNYGDRILDVTHPKVVR